MTRFFTLTAPFVFVSFFLFAGSSLGQGVTADGVKVFAGDRGYLCVKAPRPGYWTMYVMEIQETNPNNSKGKIFKQPKSIFNNTWTFSPELSDRFYPNTVIFSTPAAAKKAIPKGDKDGGTFDIPVP